MKILTREDQARKSKNNGYPLRWDEALEQEGIYEWNDPFKASNGRTVYVVLRPNAKSVIGYNAKRRELFIVDTAADWQADRNEFKKLAAELLVDVIE